MMESKFQRIWQLAGPYLETRQNDIHTRVSVKFAYRLLQKEDGDRDIVIPAVILHDVGWIRVPEDLQPKAYGSKATSVEINRIHEVEGAKIAEEILRGIEYDQDKVGEILRIVEGHDSREEPISSSDKIVKDADKLFRYSKEGFDFGFEIFRQPFWERMKIIRPRVDDWLLTDSAKEMARQEIEDRLKESQNRRN
jgi:HD superfamily phosphodiesterase